MPGAPYRRGRLRACPFCGDDKPEMLRTFGDGGWRFVILCPECRARGPEQTKPEAAEHRWNARQDSPYSVFMITG